MVMVLDYSNARLPVAELARLVHAGELAGVVRYLGPTSWPKAITRAELDSFAAAGVPCAANFETTGRSWRGGIEQGHLDGAAARAWARAAGFPDERPILQSIDEGVAPALVPTAVAYQRGFNDAGECGPQGAYSTQRVLDALFDAGLIRIGWQTNARSWSGNADDCTRAALEQHTSHSFPQFPPNAYDENTVHLDDWGQHPAPGHVDAGTGSLDQEDDMQRFHDDVHGDAYPGKSDRCALVDKDGNIILVDGCSIADSNPKGPALDTIVMEGLTVFVNDAPKEHKFRYATPVMAGSKCAGFVCRYSSNDGAWHPRVRMFRG